jgi:enoyl-CoA hydratase
MSTAIRIEDRGRVRAFVLARPNEYNTITRDLRDELSAAIDAADADPGVHVILLEAEGPAFCAGYGLDWSMTAQAKPQDAKADWDSITDLQGISQFVRVFSKLWYCSKPVIAAVHGWCIAGGTDMVLCADLIVAADDAVFGYPPARVWGVPTSAMWVYRIGFEQAKRYLLTGDEIPAAKAREIGLIGEVVPRAELKARSMALAERMAKLPLNQLQMHKLFINQTAENMGLASSRLVGSIFDGVARHTKEGVAFVEHGKRHGMRSAVSARDDPFGDYGSGPRSRRRKK